MGTELLAEFLKKILELITKFACRLIFRRMSKGVNIPRCPSCGNDTIERWAPFSVRLVFVTSVLVLSFSLVLGFFWIVFVVFFVVLILAGNFSSYLLVGIVAWGIAIPVVIVIAAGGAIFYKTFPPKRCHWCNGRWPAPAGSVVT